MREIVQEWVDNGNSDFIAAKTLEKCLKAYLVKQGEEIRKIHDLTALVIDCEKYDSAFQELEALVEGITDFAVEFRYPGGNATPEEVEDALLGQINSGILNSKN